MSDAEWAAVRPLLPVPAWLQGRGGQPKGYCHRQLLDTIRYLVAGGISWRAMPADFPDRGRVYTFFRRWREHGLVTEFHDRLRGRVREREDGEAEPTAGIIDAHSVKAAASVPSVSRGYDGGKKVGGRKRHMVTDCLGLLLVIAVTAANIGDRDAATGLLRRLRRMHRDITLVCRWRLHRRPSRLVPGQARAELGDRQAHRRHGRVRGAAAAAAGPVGCRRSAPGLWRRLRVQRSRVGACGRVRAGQADGDVIAVDLGGADYLECDLPLSGWHDAAASEEENSLAYHFYMAWRAENPEVGDLRFDQAIGYKHPLFWPATGWGI
ncbi:transposase [Streptomyces ipomoeae]|uniref:transposase n=1 Tax=Streptomyces ipomoeae TaxID=103232 RepID=UPI00215C8038|nr:transposase [Streptomyces ipomoeae]